MTQKQIFLSFQKFFFLEQCKTRKSRKGGGGGGEGGSQKCPQFIATTFWNKKRTLFRIFVVAGNTDCLLSRSAAHSLGLIRCLDEMNDLAFDAVGKPVDSDQIKIVLNEGAEPYNMLVARRIPITLLPKVKHELQRMLFDGVIEEITKPAD